LGHHGGGLGLGLSEHKNPHHEVISDILEEDNEGVEEDNQDKSDNIDNGDGASNRPPQTITKDHVAQQIGSHYEHHKSDPTDLRAAGYASSNPMHHYSSWEELLGPAHGANWQPGKYVFAL